MNRDITGERFLFGCLLLAIMFGTIALKFWVFSVEQRLADNLQIHSDIVGDDKSQTNVLTIHENRLSRVEGIAWAVWDHHSPCDGWPTRKEIVAADPEMAD